MDVWVEWLEGRAEGRKDGTWLEIRKKKYIGIESSVLKRKKEIKKERSASD